MKAVLAVAVAALLFPLSALKADTFEGTFTVKLSPWGRQATGVLKVSAKPDLMRLDLQSARGEVSTIIDLKNRQLLTLMPQAHMYMVRSLPERLSSGTQASAAFGSLVEAGGAEKILGYACTKYIVDGPEGRAEVWVTNELGEYPGLFKWVGPTGQGVAQSWETALRGRNFFPLRVVRKNSSNGVTFHVDVTDVRKGDLPDSLFAAPEGWRKYSLDGAFPGIGR